MQLKPVATATPDGNVRIARRYRWIPTSVLMEIELIEMEHREAVIETVERNEERRLESAIAAYYERYGFPGRHPMPVSSRRAVIEEFGELPRVMSRGDGLKSRSHSRAKSRFRDRRTIRQLSLAA